MSAVERAAEVIYEKSEGSVPEFLNYGIAQALADAGLLLTDADRAVLDAAELWAHDALTASRLYSAIVARREATS